MKTIAVWRCCRVVVIVVGSRNIPTCSSNNKKNKDSRDNNIDNDSNKTTTGKKITIKIITDFNIKVVVVVCACVRVPKRLFFALRHGAYYKNI